MIEVKASNKPSAQVEPTRKAATLKAATAKPQPARLRPEVLRLPENETPTEPERLPLRLLDKRGLCSIVNASFPTIWTWMRAGRFPRSRVVGGRSMWLSSEVEQWLADLPLRVLKGDADRMSMPPAGTPLSDVSSAARLKAIETRPVRSERTP
jgi:prophage regulatory protein